MRVKMIYGEVDITSKYGTRKDPFTGLPTMHYGIDYAPRPRRTNPRILAIEDGVILLVRLASVSMGNYIEVLHPNGCVSVYLHLKEFNPMLRKGSIVKAGDFLGLMGTTGNSTGEHLHFGIRTMQAQRPPSYIEPTAYITGELTLKGKYTTPVEVAQSGASTGAPVGYKFAIGKSAKNYFGTLTKIPDKYRLNYTHTALKTSDKAVLSKETMSWIALGDITREDD